jgi:Alpha/beta hydrolase
MVSFPELRDSEPSLFATEAAAWRTLAEQVTARAGEVGKELAGLSSWTGQAADAARATLTAKHTALSDAATQLAQVAPVLSDLAATLGPLRDRLHDAMNTAGDHFLEIEADGTVRPDSFVVSLLEHDAKRLSAQLTATIQGLLREATAADEHASTALRGLTAQAAGLAPASSSPTMTAAATAVPGPNTSPAAVTAWWKSLSPRQQESLLFMHGDQLGSLDGIPAVVRDRANRAQLGELTGALTERKAALEGTGSPLGEDQQHQVDDINGKLGGLAAVGKRLDVTPSATQPQAYLLRVGTDGGGRAVVAMGNPDTAGNVATYVPGTGSGLASCGGDLTRSDRMAYAATKAGSPSTSVITWVGYDAPPNLLDAASGSYAQHAEHDLSRFEDGLRATHDGAPSHNTVIGHSYGTTAVGYAARDGSLNADDLVFVASPGVGVHSPQGLHLDGVPADQMGQHVYATTAKHDIIHLADGVFGPNPSDSGFGARDFASDPGTRGPWYTDGYSGAAHSQYWDPGNAALENLGRIIAGRPAN